VQQSSSSSWTRPGWRFLNEEDGMDSVVHQCSELQSDDLALLQSMEGCLPILADLYRADILLYCPLRQDAAVVLAQAQPHSILPIHRGSLSQRKASPNDEPLIHQALANGRPVSGQRQMADGSALFYQSIYPVLGAQGQVIAAMVIETNLIEWERLRRRSKVFRGALRALREMVLRGELEGAEDISPFGEHDGILVVNAQGQVEYVSGIATNLYRKLGHSSELVGRWVGEFDTLDRELVTKVLETGRCQEREDHPRDLIWVKKAIPLSGRATGWRRWLHRARDDGRLTGVLITIRDETDLRRQEQELKVKSTMIQEIHHRVKNNLQTIASLLRMQSRRAESDEVRRALQDATNRMLSVAVIHEFLAHQDARVINIRDVSQRIINQVRSGIMDSETQIRLHLKGPNVFLPTQQATVSALLINELLQNALEHGYDGMTAGTITLSLRDEGDRVTIVVVDDGAGLPDDFDLIRTQSLGLQIVQSLAQDDLKGSFELRGRDNGVSAIVSFPKHT
jgi:two-component sensor histidine kinase/PAS domain-containing protein